MIKTCIERILNEFNETDDEMGGLGSEELSISFKIAFNTLIKYEILIAEDE
jgi:hypothetical protein